MFIQNVSMAAIKDGFYNHNDNSILIQIVDPAFGFPAPINQFKKVFQFEFLDAEDDSKFDEDFLISEGQAKEIVSILKNAMAEGNNVFVHCHAGLCRSGAVAEVGIMMGFEDTGKPRTPNLRVKTFLMRELGWTYD